jgi:predicted ATPase/transcriptional regulator with XRE-family HTH domain
MATTNATGSFAVLLQRYRRAAGLSQEELAERAGLSRRGISDLERGARRIPRVTTLRRLAEGLGLDHAAQAAFLDSADPHATAANIEPVSALALSPLPISSTSFLGRERQVSVVRKLLGRNRLLTLTGVGGVGKTRLAVEAAGACRAVYPDGVALVELASLTDPELVPSAIAQAIGVREMVGRPLLETLIATLRPSHVLLLLDNFEHLLTAAPLISELLGACARLTILATSREALRIREEQEFSVPPLELPPPGRDVPAAVLLQSASVQLFVQRAGQRVLDFQVTPTGVGVVADICRRLDGLPLAIELAAARARLLSPALLLERLEKRLSLLVGGARDLPQRQRTLRDTIAWSYELMVPGDQRLFRRLAVFVGGCTLSAAEVLCETDDDLGRPVLDGLASLVDKNLLDRANDTEDAPRFVMLGTIREYALECLTGSGEESRTRGRHATLFLDFAEAAARQLRGRERMAWVQALEQEHDNLRTALRWVVERSETEHALRLALAMWPFWELRWFLREGRSGLEQVVDLSNDQEAFASLRAQALGALAALIRLQGDTKLTVTRLVEARAMFTKLGDTAGEAFVLNGLGLIAMELEELTTATREFETSATLWRAVGNMHELAFVLLNLAYAVEFQSDYVRAQRLLEESLRLRRLAGDDHGTLPVLVALARLARKRNDRESTLALLRESLAVAGPLGRNRSTVIVLDGLAAFALQEAQFATTVRFLGSAANVLKSADFTAPSRDQPDRLDTTAAVRARLGDDEFTAAWAEGQALTPDKLVAQALSILGPLPSDQTSR